jgi:transposase
VIPKYDLQTRKGPFQTDLYRERNLVEYTSGHLKEFRRLAFRVETLGEHYKANWLIVEIVRSFSNLEQPQYFSK